ncbi:MAG TPA: phosphate acyltransferase, partial [Vicinamibacteria bacterium]|nr:phosphate acyltransferase [Vicinamibacteria bacterium]
MDAIERIHERARAARRHIVLPEGTEPRTVLAAAAAARAGIARTTLLGVRDEILAVARETGTDLAGVEIADPPGEREEDAALRA